MICNECGGYRHNPIDITEHGLYDLKNHTMWWAAKGPADLEFVPKFGGLGSSPLWGTKTDAFGYEFTPEERELNIIGQKFMQWFEGIFEEARLIYNPDAPSRIGNLMLCPELGVNFCSEPSKWSERSHIYEVSVTGKAFTTSSEVITEARIRAGEILSRNRYRTTLDFFDDPERKREARKEVMSWAKGYWLGRDSLNETIVDGQARIVRLVMEKEEYPKRPNRYY